MEMFGNGAVIGIMRTITVIPHLKTHKVHFRETSVLSVAARGSQAPYPAGPRVGTGSCRTASGTTATGFAAPLLQSRFCKR